MVLLVVAGSFVIHPLILLLLLASQSLWVRGSSWADVGLRRPTAVHHTLLQVVVGTFIILVAIRVVIVPGAVWLTGVPLDLSVFDKPGDKQALWIWLGQAWTLAAFGEEMVFRGYLIRRVCDLVGDATAGRAIALIASSSLFGLAHSYQGPAGVIAAGTIGGILGLLVLRLRSQPVDGHSLPRARRYRGCNGPLLRPPVLAHRIVAARSAWG